jgi:hypothetical protein
VGLVEPPERQSFGENFQNLFGSSIEPSNAQAAESFTGATLGIVGEAGPEAVIPLNQAK